MKIFVSTPSEDLSETRKAICEILDSEDIVPLSMESLIATPNPPWSELEEKIEQVKFLILVLGDEYGKKDKNDIGYTEKEFDYAERQGIPILAFIKEYDQKELICKPELTAFKNRVSDDSKRTVSFWESKEQIVPLVCKAVKKLKDEKEPEEGAFMTIRSANESDEKVMKMENELVEVMKFYPNYPESPVGSCAVAFKRLELSDFIMSFNHSEIMDIFRILTYGGSLETVGYGENGPILQIGSIRLSLKENEKKDLEKAFAEYKDDYLHKLKEITQYLQTDDFSSSDKRKFAYRIVRISYGFWELLLEFSNEHDFLVKDGKWDMFSPNQYALNITHPVTCKDLNYNGIMHAYFNVENDDKVGSGFVWLVLNLEMTKDNNSILQYYSKRNIWGCKTAYDWCVNELFPVVCSKYGCNKNHSYQEKENYKVNDDRSRVSELQMFILENGIKLSQQEIQSIQEALKYCLSTKILPINEYDYIISKLGLSGESFDRKSARNLSEDILLKLNVKWADANLGVDADHLLRCINAFTDGYSQLALSTDEVANVYHIFSHIIGRMDEIKFIEKYKYFYS